MSKEPISKIYLIVEKIEYIEQIIKNSKSITSALDDEVTTRPAILMHLTAIAENFNHLKREDKMLLDYFDAEDVKGMYDVRTYIAHEYEGVNLAIVEWIIRNGLPKFKEQCQTIINKES
jgi:uncharacterized protein with HEPN domain